MVNTTVLLGLAFYQYNQNKQLKSELENLKKDMENLNKELNKQSTAILQMNGIMQSVKKDYNNKLLNIETDVGYIKKDLGTSDVKKKKRKIKKRPVITKNTKEDLNSLLECLP